MYYKKKSFSICFLIVKEPEWKTRVLWDIYVLCISFKNKKTKTYACIFFCYFYLCKIIKYFFNTVLDALNCDFWIQIIFIVYALVLFLIRLKHFLVRFFLNFVQTRILQCLDLTVCVFSDYLWLSFPFRANCVNCVSHWLTWSNECKAKIHSRT